MVIALDPGETTGWSTICVEMDISTKGINLSDRVSMHSHGQIDCFKNAGALDTSTAVDTGHRNSEAEARGVARIMMIMDKWPQAAVVIEDFILERSEKSRDLLSAVRITARVEQELWHRGRYAFIQDRANPKSTMNDKRLKQFGRYQREGGLNHARDADRHALYFLRRCMVKPWLRHQAWPYLFDEPTTKVTKKRAPNAPGARIQF